MLGLRCHVCFSPVVANRGGSLVVELWFSLRWLLLLHSGGLGHVGFSGCGRLGSRAQARELGRTGLVALLRGGSSQTRDQPCVSCFASSAQSLSPVWLFATPWTAARQASLSVASSRSLLKLMSVELVMPSDHLILCACFAVWVLYHRATREAQLWLLKPMTMDQALSCPVQNPHVANEPFRCALSELKLQQMWSTYQISKTQ